MLFDVGIIFFESKNLIDFFSNLIKYLNAFILGKKIKNRYAIVSIYKVFCCIYYIYLYSIHLGIYKIFCTHKK